jgi:hypothetical protein
MRGRYLALALAAALAGCGGGDDDKGGGSVGGGDKQQARAVAQSYLDAVARKDWKAVCATRASGEVKELAKAGGSCEKTFAALLGKQPVELFKNAKAGAVRIKGDLAGVDVTQKGQTAKFITLAAVREGDGWKLKDVPEGKVP